MVLGMRLSFAQYRYSSHVGVLVCTCVCRFSRVRARKVLRKSSKTCTHVFMSGEMWTSVFKGGK